MLKAANDMNLWHFIADLGDLVTVLAEVLVPIFLLRAIFSFFLRIEKGRKAHLRAMPYLDYLQSPEWRGLRKRKLSQAGYRCEACGCRRLLQVHHLTYQNRGDEPLSDLKVLCDECHRGVHEVW